MLLSARSTHRLVTRAPTSARASHRIMSTSTSSPSTVPGPTPTTTATAAETPLVMQLIVDGEAAATLGWPKGPWMAQAAHAAIAALTVSASSPSTAEYVSASSLATMHKVVLQTPRTGKAKMDLRELSARLTEARNKSAEQRSAEPADEDEFPMHYLWIEQPENVPTCLAIAPNRKPAALKKVLRPCTLLKD